MDKKRAFLDVSFFLMTVWLLVSSNCATGMISLIIGALILIIMKTPFMMRNTNLIGVYALLIIFIALGLQFTIGALTTIIELFGRDATLTGRTELWEDVLNIGTNPIIGVGYGSFWLGERMATLWAKYSWQPTETHNGYLDIYLDLGLAGLILMVGIIISAFRNIRERLLSNQEYAGLHVTFLVVALLYNITEAAFRPGLLMYFRLYSSCG